MTEKFIGEYEREYKKLNKAQKDAVDSIDGPVMVVAGPGTGKTQVLALRIGNILLKTDTPADGVLCLTFTNSGVAAMRERLHKYIGPTASRVNIFTFHGFGMEIIKAHYTTLGLDVPPKLMDDMDAVALCDQILHSHEWQYLRPRSNATLYFRDLKALISLLKRERLTPDNFLEQVDEEIKNIKSDEGSISTRGESKGELKKDIIKKIESLERTREVVRFFELYEQAKKDERNKNVLLDYDDVLAYLVKIIEESEEVRDELREKFLYVLIDEHQDSSGIQNEFLQKVWGDTERPNIFVVGDDRQLIYGFGGASLEYFEGFKHAFGKAKLVSLVENYRSTQVILDSAHILLASAMSGERLMSQLETKNADPIRLVEADYPRDEIIACALDIKDKFKAPEDYNQCAILVPKNRQVRSAVAVLRDLGLPVSSYNTLRFFDSEEAMGFLQVLKIISNPYDHVALANSFFDKLSGIPPLLAHKFMAENNLRGFSLGGVSKQNPPSLFKEENAVNVWIQKLTKWVESSQDLNVYSLVQLVGDELLLAGASDHEALVSRVEIIRTLLHLALGAIEKNPKIKLNEFLDFINRLEEYDENIPLAVFGKDEGIKVLTLHASKGLEFEYVWIAHLDERSLASGKRQSFSLPERIATKIEQKDEEVLKRQLYVAITRAKHFCALSYAKNSYVGGSQELAHVVADLVANLGPDLLQNQSSAETEKLILKHGPKDYIQKIKLESKSFDLQDLITLVSKEYADRKVSVSLLNNFFECPWKWYFRNLLQLPEAKSASLEFGNAVHASIDNILKLNKIPSQLELTEIVNREVSKMEDAGEIKLGQNQREVLRLVVRWVENRLPEIEDKRENEKSVALRDDRFPHLNIYGKIDLVEYLNNRSDGKINKIRVTDFKTGSARKKTEIEKTDDEGRMSSYLRQLAMYSYLLEQNSKMNIEVSESRLEFLEAKDAKEGFYDRVITPKEIMLLVQDIMDYDQYLKDGTWTSRPCNYNSFGKNTACEYCQRAQIYKSV